MLRSIFSTPNDVPLATNIPTSVSNKFNPLNIPNTQPNIVPTKEIIEDIAGKLNTNDNAAIQDGLNQMRNIVSSSLNELE